MSDWTDDRVAELKRMWTEGVSASVIAKRLGRTTRNAVIGKVHRLGLEKRKSTCRVIRMPYLRAPSDRGSKGRQTPPRKPAAPRLTSVVIAGQPLRIPLAALTNETCRWPIGDPKAADFAFCGLPARKESPYCCGHHRECHSDVRTAHARAEFAEAA